jgi:hypothetical protein
MSRLDDDPEAANRAAMQKDNKRGFITSNKFEMEVAWADSGAQGSEFYFAKDGHDRPILERSAMSDCH